MGSSGHYFSENGNSERHNEWRKQCSDGSNRVLQLRFHQVVRCGSYGLAIINSVSFRFMLFNPDDVKIESKKIDNHSDGDEI